MLLFLKGPLHDAVRDGQKTQTLRTHRGAGLRPGDPLAFMSGGGRPVLRAQVEAVDQILPDELTEADARREGLASLAELHVTLTTLGLHTALTRIRFRLTPS